MKGVHLSQTFANQTNQRPIGDEKQIKPSSLIGRLSSRKYSWQIRTFRPVLTVDTQDSTRTKVGKAHTPKTKSYLSPFLSRTSLFSATLGSRPWRPVRAATYARGLSSCLGPRCRMICWSQRGSRLIAYKCYGSCYCMSLLKEGVPIRPAGLLC